MNDHPHSQSVPNILVVDDVPENLQLMTGILKHSGYKVRPVSSGVLALEAARKMPPDLILLDIHMPEMDGYEVCRRLKAEAALAEVPVIFLSALNECSAKVRGLRQGGSDYITKPFQTEEVLARIEVHLEICRLRLELKNQNDLLDEKVRLRTRELAEARDRLAILDKAKSDFLALISHELRTPLNGVFGITELIFDSCDLTPQVKDLLLHYNHSRQRILSILDDALLLTQIGLQSGLLTAGPVSLTNALCYAMANVADRTKMLRIAFGPCPQFSAPVLGDNSMLVKALESLLEIAGKFAKPGSTVEFSGLTTETEAVLEIKTAGYNIPQDALAKIFEVLAIPEAITAGGDLGLKLPLADRIIALMGGSVSVENVQPPGILLKARFKRGADCSEENR